MTVINFFFFSWDIIALQCCVNSAVQQSESAIICIYTLPLGLPSRPHPLIPPPFFLFIIYLFGPQVAEWHRIHLLLQETWVWSLSQRDHLEKEMATHSSVFAWEIPWTEEPDGLQSMGSHTVGHDLATKQRQQFIYLFGCVGSWLQHVRTAIFVSSWKLFVEGCGI